MRKEGSFFGVWQSLVNACLLGTCSRGARAACRTTCSTVRALRKECTSRQEPVARAMPGRSLHSSQSFCRCARGDIMRHGQQEDSDSQDGDARAKEGHNRRKMSFQFFRG